MREVMDSVPMRGRIVIGEGERDEAPMLYIGEELGGGDFPEDARAEFPEVDIAVDPLEGTNLCALGANNAIAVLAAAERGGLLYAPDIYMDKIVVGPSCRGAVDIDAPVEDNLKNIARRLGRDIEDLTVICLERGRHKKLIDDVRAAGARIRLISDGDLSAGISAAVEADDRQVLDVPAQTAGDIFKIILNGSIYIDGAAARRADDDLVHVDVRSVKQAPSFSRGEHGDSVISAKGTQVCTLERVDRDVHLGKLDTGLLRKLPAADVLADVEHRGLVTFTFADDDAAAHRHRVHDLSHGFDSDMVRILTVALAHCPRRGYGRGLSHPQKIE
jgi:hypothetical protein